MTTFWNENGNRLLKQSRTFFLRLYRPVVVMGFIDNIIGLVQGIMNVIQGAKIFMVYWRFFEDVEGVNNCFGGLSKQYELDSNTILQTDFRRSKRFVHGFQAQ